MQRKKSEYELKIADVEVGGDIHRVVLSGVALPDHLDTAFKAREFFIDEFDEFRYLLISPPYGHEDMCADVLFPSQHKDADFAYVIMECMGYPYLSGSNTMATVAALYEYGLVTPEKNGETELYLESPLGLVYTKAFIEDDKVQSVTMNADATYVLSENEIVHVPDIGDVTYSLVWSGAYFVMIEADTLGLKLDAGHIPAMKSKGKAIIETLEREFDVTHHEFGKIPPPGFIHFIGDYEQTGEARHQGHGATFGYPNTIWNCPTGTGTAARMALMKRRGQIGTGDMFENISATGNMFTGRVIREIRRGEYDAIEAEITARPFVLSTLDMHIDFENPLMTPYKNVRKILNGTE